MLYEEVPILLDFEENDILKVIEKSGLLLMEVGMCNGNYIKSMKNIYKESGPYIVIAQGIAMPHARPEDGSIKSGFSLIRLKNPINFGNVENDPVKLVVGLSAKNDDDHIKIIQMISFILDENIDVLMKGSEKNIRRIIKNIEGEI